MRVILRRVAPKGSLSIHGFFGRGAKAILSLALLAQDDARHAVLKSPQRAKRSGRPPARSAGTLTASESERPYL